MRYERNKSIRKHFVRRILSMLITGIEELILLSRKRVRSKEADLNGKLIVVVARKTKACVPGLCDKL